MASDLKYKKIKHAMTSNSTSRVNWKYWFNSQFQPWFTESHVKITWIICKLSCKTHEPQSSEDLELNFLAGGGIYLKREKGMKNLIWNAFTFIKTQLLTIGFVLLLLPFHKTFISQCRQLICWKYFLFVLCLCIVFPSLNLFKWKKKKIYYFTMEWETSFEVYGLVKELFTHKT